MASYGTFWEGSASLWAALACSGRFSEALKSVLDYSGHVWEALEGLWVGCGKALGGIGRGIGSSSGAALERMLPVLDGFRRFWTAWKALDCSLELVRSLPNDQNGLLDHLALKGPKFVILSSTALY